jgi:DNA-binding NarL/FixJ family response regulator
MTGHQEPPALTEEDLRLLKLLAEGHTNRQIAGELGVSYPTVRRRIEAILDKLRRRNPFDPLPPQEA